SVRILMRTGDAFLLTYDVLFPFGIPFFGGCFQPDNVFPFRIIADDVLASIAIDIDMGRTFIALMIVNHMLLPVSAFILGVLVPYQPGAWPIHADQIDPAILIHIH